MIRACRSFCAVVLIITFALFGNLSVSAESMYPKPTNDFFVNDYANIITLADAKQMQSKGEALYHSTTAQVVVVTVENMGGDVIENYSINLARQWGIGSEEQNNGVLLLLALEEREIRIEVGSGLEGALTDVKTGFIIDNYGMEYLRADNYSAGLTEIYNALVNEVYIEYGKQPDEDYTPVDELSNSEAAGEIGRVGLIIIIIILAMILSSRRRGRPGGGLGMPFIFFGGHGGGFRGGSGGGFSGGGFRGGGGGFSGGGSSRRF